MESNTPKYPELEQLDSALAEAAERLTDANKYYLDLILARIALRELKEQNNG